MPPVWCNLFDVDIYEMSLKLVQCQNIDWPCESLPTSKNYKWEDWSCCFFIFYLFLFFKFTISVKCRHGYYNPANCKNISLRQKHFHNVIIFLKTHTHLYKSMNVIISRPSESATGTMYSRSTYRKIGLSLTQPGLLPESNVKINSKHNFWTFACISIPERFPHCLKVLLSMHSRTPGRLHLKNL